MHLFFRKTGEGTPMVILHGVFGSSDNLFTVSKNIADSGFGVFTVDARNHGQSPRDDRFNYDVMADDLNEFLIQQDIKNPIILGHSMGGKTVMQYAMKYDNFSKLVIVDIAPRYYPTHHNHILNGLAAIPTETLTSRKEAEDIFSEYVSDPGEKQFILKNLYRNDEGKFGWRINVPVISRDIYQIGAEIDLTRKIEKPVLFIRGGESAYISDEDLAEIKRAFLNAEIVTIDGANHWVHATKPAEFVRTVVEFSSK